MRCKLAKCIEFYRSQVRMIYGSTVTAGLVDTIRVAWDSQDTPISQMAYTHPKDRVVVVRPFDPAATNAVLKAVQNAGLSAYTAKTEVIVTIPSPTSETVERNKRRIRELAEDGRVSIRHVRQEFREAVKSLPDDERKKAEKNIQKEIESAISEVEFDSRERIAKL